MDIFLEQVLYKLLEFISQYAFFIRWEYYEGLFEKYFCGPGFIIGFIFVLVVFFSSAEEQNKAGFFKVLPIIAVINSCYIISSYVENMFGQGFQFDNTVSSLFNATDNIISGFILTLVVSSCYRGYPGRAFLLGVATCIALPMLNYLSFGDVGDFMPILYMVIRILLIGFVCSIISSRRYFYTGWIAYFIVYLLTKIALYFLPLFSNSLGVETAYLFDYTVFGAIAFFARFTMDLIGFLLILGFAIFFEKGVLKKKRRKTSKS